jgi:CRISPR-associated protein Csy2
MRRFLLIPHLKLHNANAMSSPYTIGFPAMTAWLGGVHALQRKLQQDGFADVQLFKTAVSCHDVKLHTHKGRSDYVYSIIGTGNPLTKTGDRPAFIEEARCDLDVSLLIEFSGVNTDDIATFQTTINQHLQRMKFAAGDVMGCRAVSIESCDEDEPQTTKKLLNKLMLGHVLIERRDLMIEAMEHGQDALDALLDHLKITHQSTEELDAQGRLKWSTTRLTKGWLVPIAVGFQGISELGVAQHQRDADTPHRFAESVVTLGEFAMPHRIQNLDAILWAYHVDLAHDMYLCKTSEYP